MNQEPESENPEAMDMSEADVERLLSDAFAVPPVPKTLLKRLDRAVAEQWGVSVGLARNERSRLVQASSGTAHSWKMHSWKMRSWKIWPVAASLAMVLVLAAVFRGNAYAYSWAAVVEALSRQAVVRFGLVGTGESESSWFSLSSGQFSRRLGNVERLYDLRQGVVLERGIADAQVKRFKFSDASLSTDRERVAIALLAGNLNGEADLLRLPALRLREQSWSRKGGAVEVKVTFGAEAPGNELQLTLVVDPETRLPQRCLVRQPDGTLLQQVFTYPQTLPERLIAQAFPADLPVFDVTGRIAVAESIAGVASTNTVAVDDGAGANSAADTATGTAARKARGEIRLTGAASLGWSPITPARISVEEAVAEIDATLERLWREKGVVPAERASDAERLRRVYLDLAGRTPTVAEARNYLNDASPDRYVRLVDRLLASPDHATHLATVWRTILLPEGVDLDRFGGIPAFDEWLSGRFGANVPYDQLVRELLLAEGRLSQSGPLLFYSATKLNADELAARTARVFLGMRLECAQCHDDPFEPWTQQDFWSYAAFFARISRPKAALEAVSTVMRVRDIDRGEVMMPDSQAPVPPRFLDGSNVDETPAAAARRQQLARWLTGPDNPYFARAAVNRVWAHLFGRGIVDPVDGFGKRNPPRSSELLDLLAAQLLANDFNLRESFRTVALTRAYQLSSGSETDDLARHQWFAQMNVKMLTAEQIYDCMMVASMLVGTDGNGFSIARVGNTDRDEFLLQFKTLPGRPTEFQGGIPQALTLMNGTLISSATDLAQGGLLNSLEAPFFTDDQRIEVIYLATLSRRPTPAEWALLRDYIRGRDANASIREPLADILWALLNGAEFTMNH
jgi:hypothetical protein